MAIDVSIITPTFNSEKYLQKTYESLVDQSFTNWEWIVVDDMSSDSTVSILKELSSKDERMRFYLQEKNMGAGPARNRAIKESKGKYIAFLDSDDIWHKEKLQIQIDYMKKNKSAFSHTSYGFIDSSGNKIRSTFHVSSKKVGYKDLLKRTEISCLTAVYDSEKIGKRYMPDIRRKQDYGLWLDILKDGYFSEPIDVELAYYRQHSGSATSNKFSLIMKHYQFLRVQQGLSMINSLKYTIYWGINGLIKYKL